MEDQDFDDILDEVNEFHLLYDYVSDFGLVSGDELNFNGDVESARRYEENEDIASLFINFDDDIVDTNTISNHEIHCNGRSLNINEHTILSAFNIHDNPISPHPPMTASLLQPNNEEIFHNQPEDVACNRESFDIDDGNQKDNYKNQLLGPNTSNEVKFPLTRYIPSQLQVTTFQYAREPRTKYLVRSLKLWQEFSNSGDIEKMRVLLYDILDVKCAMINGPCPPIVGRDTIYAQYISILRNIPDFCVFYTNIVRSKRRVITMKSNNFGTFAYANNTNDETIVEWNIFENTPIDRMTEHQKLQKVKYDALKSQNKDIKFERRVTRFLMLSKDHKRFIKLMSCDDKIDVY